MDDTLPFAVTLDWIAEAQKSIPADECVDYYMLKLAERQAVIEIMHLFTTEKQTGPSRELLLVFAFEYFNGVPHIVTNINVALKCKLPNGFLVAKVIRLAHCCSKCLRT